MKSNQIEFFAIIWGAMLVISVSSMMFVRESAVFITITASIVALLATVAIAASNSTTQNSDAEASEKAKNTPANNNSDALLRLLDEDDLAELRSRVKRRLIDQIEGSGDGELSSLDALLADQKSKRR